MSGPLKKNYALMHFVCLVLWHMEFSDAPKCLIPQIDYTMI